MTYLCNDNGQLSLTSLIFFLPGILVFLVTQQLYISHLTCLWLLFLFLLLRQLLLLFFCLPCQLYPAWFPHPEWSLICWLEYKTLSISWLQYSFIWSKVTLFLIDFWVSKVSLFATIILWHIFWLSVMSTGMIEQKKNQTVDRVPWEHWHNLSAGAPCAHNTSTLPLLNHIQILSWMDWW